MRKLIQILSLFLIYNCFSQTQSEMNKEAYDLFKEADKKLNSTYQNILEDYKSDTLFITNLKKAQRIWIDFRDAELEMKYPNYSDFYYGSSHPMCRAYYLRDLTLERVNKLEIWVKGIEEGDMCSGSIKSVEEPDLTDNKQAFIEKDKTIWVPQDINGDYKIFGYKKPNTDSEKLILISVFTNDVEDNPYNCKYGSYYDTQFMDDLKIKYLESINEFIKVEIIKNDQIIDTAYMIKKWFHFETD